ncbi:MAG: hypothetical protein IPI35_22620 [Deltaproteobacteria bacterium]|nr:hypothetical protein [Deltaproteobacteria bacterium]
MTLGRRTFLFGLGALALRPSLARADRPTVLVLSSDTSARTQTLVESFKANVTDVTRLSYELGAEEDAAAFLADNLRELQVSLVFAIGDRAFLAAAREYVNVPMLYTDVTDTSAVSGREDAVGLSVRVDPQAALTRLVGLLPRMTTLGAIRGLKDPETLWWDKLKESCETLKLKLDVRQVNASADVANASAALLAQCGGVLVQPDPQLWAPSVASRLLYDASLAKVPVIAFDRSWLRAANPAPFVLESSAKGLGAAAAQEAMRRLSLSDAGEARTFPEPWLVGSKAALRALTIPLKKESAALVEEWID